MITNCLEVEAGSYINPENGKIEKEQPFYMASHIWRYKKLRIQF